MSYIVCINPGFIQFPIYIKNGYPYREGTDKVINTDDYKLVEYVETPYEIEALIKKLEESRNG